MNVNIDLIKKVVLTRVCYLQSGLMALGRSSLLRCSENNVRKLKIRCKFTWLVVAKIFKLEVCKLELYVYTSACVVMTRYL
jgi:hypothetical protein